MRPAEAHFHTFNVVSYHKSAMLAQPSDEEIKLLTLIKKEAIHHEACLVFFIIS